ncbi:hypothetical protein MFRU_069g00010 [Monilinia fructicola]|uniref:Uncharacterized protein n=1 Tax=Monilinia fructicola TaxID=38448 RepID=A0A5M9J6Z7_MONFR|nr:hypothetical protein EYC84_010526 [Monilinia fructicola]KAG4025069.1 hypothetical protein MFRU_069g00010 [Monilinia fructicola]
MSLTLPKFLLEVYGEITLLYSQSHLNISSLYHVYTKQLSKELEVDIHANRWAVSEVYANYALNFITESQNEDLLRKRRSCWKRFCAARLWELHSDGSRSSEDVDEDSTRENERKRNVMDALLKALVKTWSKVAAVDTQRGKDISEHTANMNDAVMMESTFTNTTAATSALPILNAVPTAITTSSQGTHSNTNTINDYLTEILSYFWSLTPSAMTITGQMFKILISLFIKVISYFPLLVIVMGMTMLIMSPVWVWHVTVRWFENKPSGWMKSMKSWFEIWGADPYSDAGADGYGNESTHHNAGSDSSDWEPSFNNNGSFIPPLLPQIQNLQSVLRNLITESSKLQLSTTSTNIYNPEDVHNLDRTSCFRKYSDDLITASMTSTNILRSIIKDASRALNKLERVIDRRLILPRNCIVAFRQGSEETPCISVSEWERVWMITLVILGLGMIGLGIRRYCRHRRDSSSTSTSSHQSSDWSQWLIFLGGFLILGLPLFEYVTLYQRSPSLILAESTYSLQETLLSYHTIQTSKVPSLVDLFTQMTSCVQEIEAKTTDLHGTQQRLLYTTEKRDKELGASFWSWMPPRLTSKKYIEEVNLIKRNKKAFQNLEEIAKKISSEGEKVKRIVRRVGGWMEGVENKGMMGEGKIDIGGRNMMEDGIGLNEVEELKELKREINWIRETLHRLRQIVE